VCTIYILAKFVVSLKGLIGSRSRKVAVIAGLLIVVLAVSVYAYLASLPPPPGPMVTITSPPLQFSVQIDKTQYNVGENMTITFRLKNTSNGTITIAYPEYDLYLDGRSVALFDFVVTRVNGTEIYRWSDNHLHLDSVYRFTLNPGQEINQTYIWDQHVEFPNYTQVPVNTYYVRAVMPSMGAGSFFTIIGGPYKITLETPAITFLIR
jgi:hypothetical protein